MAVKEGGKKSVSILSNKFNEPGDGKAFLFAGREHAFGGSSLSKLFGGGKAPFTRQLDIVLARVQITFGWALVLKRSDGKARGGILLPSESPCSRSILLGVDRGVFWNDKCKSRFLLEIGRGF